MGAARWTSLPVAAIVRLGNGNMAMGEKTV